MVKRSPDLDDVFRALADPTRRAMILRLARGPATIGELGEPHAMSKPAVTKHVKVLERAGLLRREIDGRIHRCGIDPAPLQTAQRWVERVRAHWERQFDQLADYLNTVERKKRS